MAKTLILFRKQLFLIIILVCFPTFSRAVTLIELLIVLGVFPSWDGESIPCADNIQYSLVIFQGDCNYFPPEQVGLLLEFKPDTDLQYDPNSQDITQYTSYLESQLTDMQIFSVPDEEFTKERITIHDFKQFHILTTNKYPSSLHLRKPGYIYVMTYSLSYVLGGLFDCFDGSGPGKYDRINMSLPAVFRYVPSTSSCSDWQSTFTVNSQSLNSTSMSWVVTYTAGNLSYDEILNTSGGNRILAAVINSAYQLGYTAQDYNQALLTYNPLDASTNRKFIKNCYDYSPNKYKCPKCNDQ